jgi:hypothetical protein
MNEKKIIKKILKDWSVGKKNVKCVNGCYFPESKKSQHQKFPVHSEELSTYKKSLLETLGAFHEYAEDNNILYSLYAGTLIGYYWNGDMIPWDDDIDIIVSESSFRAIEDNLWRNGERIDKTTQLCRNCDHQQKLRHQRIGRLVDLGGVKYALLSVRGSLFKLIPLDDFSKIKPGGIDIVRCRTSPTGILTEAWKRDRICFGPTDDSLSKDYPVVTYAGIKTRAVVRELGEPYLDQAYRSVWRIQCHPVMKKEYINTEPKDR